ncbi:hypothetical protein [Leucobacter manosquensis]|uniref:HNH endonuclease n=1 Tax=Leucobacter manosquensis TaxID=2810611 RepID=A0ABS5M414_9MICO|nr:hypothetical protein [Leucobacter manosquensis]MBS3181932.1 hypothetical protein [Leucobacter manosquensis]
MGAVTSVCILCGGTGLTRAHFVPRAIREMLPNQSRSFSVMGEAATSSPGPVLELTEKAHGRGPFDTQPRVLCGTCNNAWMTKYEDITGPLLAKMICMSEQTTVTDEQAHAVATWALAAMLIRSTVDVAIQRLASDFMRAFREHGIQAVEAQVAVFSLANSRALFSGVAVGSTYISDIEGPEESALGLIFLKEIVVAVGAGKFAWLVQRAAHVLSSGVALTWPEVQPHQGWPTRGEVHDDALLLALGIKVPSRSMFVPSTPVRRSTGSIRKVVRVPAGFDVKDINMVSDLFENHGLIQ